MNIKKKIIRFVKYHNAFVVVMVLAFIGIGGVFANEDIRDKVIGEEIVVETKGLDNSAILACDLEAFDAMMRIVEVTADAENYFVEYAYQTLAIEDNAWKEITRQETLNVSRAGLEGKDLPLYLIEELGEIVESELAFLKEVQENEMAKGETEVVEIIDTTGLLGLLSDIIIKYKPEPAPPAPASVVTPARARVAPIAPAPVAPVAVAGCMDSTALNYDATATQDNGSCQYPVAAPALVCAADHLDLCDTQDLCEGVGLYWYNGVCDTTVASPADALVCVEFTYSEWGECLSDGAQSRSVLTSLPDGCVDGEPVVAQTCEYISDTDTGPVCGADNLNLCLAESDCSVALGFWYNDICNTVVAPVCAADNIGLCDTQVLCEGVGLYWYNEVCNPEAQVILGCMDSTATNYNPDATEDDGNCEYPLPTCVEFTYSDWCECQTDGTQTRTVSTSLPDGCVDGNPVISQPCAYEPAPVPAPDPEPAL